MITRIGLFMMTICVAILLALAFSPAFGQTPQEWGVANFACQEAPIIAKTGKDNPACKARDQMADAMIRKGWMPANHNIWLSPEQQTWFGVVMRDFDRQAAANPTLSFDMMPAMLLELRRKFTDAQIFAIWNEQRPAIQAYAPYGAAIMTSLMKRLAMTYARLNDPRYTLEQ